MRTVWVSALLLTFCLSGEAMADCSGDVAEHNRIVAAHNAAAGKTSCETAATIVPQRIALLQRLVAINARMAGCKTVKGGTSTAELQKVIAGLRTLPGRCAEQKKALLELQKTRDEALAAVAAAKAHMGGPGSPDGGKPDPFSATGEENVYRLWQPGGSAGGPPAEARSLRERLREKLARSMSDRDAESRAAVERYRNSLSAEDRKHFDEAMGTASADPGTPPAPAVSPADASTPVAGAGDTAPARPVDTEGEIMRGVPEPMRSGNLGSPPPAGARPTGKRWYEDVINEGRTANGLPAVE